MSREEKSCRCGHAAEDGEVLICRCEEVTQEMIHEAIRDGAMTVDAVKKRTRAGMGFCQGRTCRRLVARQLAQETGQKIDDLMPPTFRAPVRPVKINLLAESNDEE